MEFKRFLAAVSAAAVVCLLLLTSCSSKDDPGAASSPSGPASETPAASGTAGLLAQIQDKGQLTIALEGTWAPWGYHDEDGQLVGYDVEIGRAIAEKLGVEPVFAEGEWSGLLAGLEAGRYDVMINGMDVDEDGFTTNGVKLSMFDISDNTDVKEVQKYVMKNVYSADVMYDYRAALIDVGKNIIGFSANSGDGESYYVFSYDKGKGFACLMEETINGTGYQTARGVYIDQVLYVVKGNIIEAYGMEDYKKVGDIIL